MKTNTEKLFNNAIKQIKGQSENLAQAIHDAGLFAIAQVNEHGNDGFGVRLIDAMGKKHDTQRVVNWLVKFGKFGVKNGVLIYKNRKDILPENLPTWIENADKTPYWELTPQKKIVEKVDYLAMVASIIKRHQKVEKDNLEGKEIEEKNIDVLKDLSLILEKHQIKVDKTPEMVSA